MQLGKDIIEKLRKKSIGYWRRGRYEESYTAIKEAAAICAKEKLASDECLPVLLQEARSAYLVGRFDEASSLLGSIRSRYEYYLHKKYSPEALETAVISANVERRKGNFKAALESLSPFEEASLRDYPYELLGEKFLVEGACYYYLNNIEKADEKLESALGLSSQCGDSYIRSRVLSLMGLVADYKGMTRASEYYLDRANSICRKNHDSYGEAASLLNLSILYYRMGNMRKARENAARAGRLFLKSGWMIGVCRSALAAGNVEKFARNFKLADRHYKEALRIVEANSFKRELALVHEFIGDIEFEKGNLEKARSHFEASLKIGKQISPHGDIVIESLRRLGALSIVEGDTAGSKKRLLEALRNAQRLDERVEKAIVIRLLARIFIGEDKFYKGMKLYKKAIEIFQKVGSNLELAKSYLEVSELLYGRRHPEDLQMLWSALLKAESLFSTMGISYWMEKTNMLIKKVIDERGARPSIRSFIRKSSKFVTIKYSPDLFIEGQFAAASPAMLKILEQIRFSARFRRPVLITGETGTGKELVAKLIHNLSIRRNRPFIAVNCAAIPDHLFESEFFGHKKGSFTGALIDRKGLFEEASNGTLFLDEVGELSPLQQVKFLRVLQERKVRRLGDNIERMIDVRIVSATNRNLEEDISKSKIRDDFYYRINAERIHIPPLRQRREDIVAIIMFRFFGGNDDQDEVAYIEGKAIDEAEVDIGKGEFKSSGFFSERENNVKKAARAKERAKILKIEAAALRYLQDYPWPGNVRELIAVVDRIRMIAHGRPITVDMLPSKIRMLRPIEFGHSFTISDTTTNNEKLERIKKALSLCSGNKSAAAKWLGISRGTLYKELRRGGLEELIQNKSSIT